MTLRRETFDRLTTAELYELLRLRSEVFVVEQECAYPDLDGRDTEPATWHFWVEEEGAPVAYLRVLRDADALRIGRVVTAKSARGRGLSGRLMEAALEIVGDEPSVLDAQSYVAGFYARYGFRPSGPEFIEDGIPHLPMRRG